MPDIPNFTTRPQTLVDEWQRPVGDFDDSLWPSEFLDSLERHPTGWITVEQFEYAPGSGTASVSAFLTDMTGWSTVAKTRSWSARYLGEYLHEDDPSRDSTGIQEEIGDSRAEFLVRVHKNHNLFPLTVELSHPFVWFWDAIRDKNDWTYLDSAGQQHPLVRTIVMEDAYRVEFRALELRRYLNRREQIAVIQYDHVIYADSRSFTRVDSEIEVEWASFDWVALSDKSISGKNSFSRLLGKRLVPGLQQGPNPVSLDWDNPAGKEFPEFIYGVNSETGETKTFTSNPDELANYFGANPEAPHYLTPVYFDPKVMNRYRDEPSRYSVSSSRLDCLGLWGVSIGESSAGLVEVYLGDLGRDLPWQEWPHWKAHNVLPSGNMSEDRFRRDFLAQWAGKPTSLEAMRESLAALQEASDEALGWELIRKLDGSTLQEFRNLRLPTTVETRELMIPVITLAKVFVDAINERAIRKHLSVESTSDRSLTLLEQFVQHHNGDSSLVMPFRNLYKLRSSGGLAHWNGGDVAKTMEKLGLSGKTPRQVVEFFASGLKNSCDSITRLL